VNDATDLEADRRLLRRAVTAAGALALEHFGSGSGHWHKAPGQVVTETDLAVDRLLHDILIGARPDDGWLSEERADDGSRHRRRRVWIVDPIDGTRAFADGAPEFAISIALVVEGRPVLGAVLFTFLPELLRGAAHYRMVIFATILVVATLFMPRGIIFPLVEHLVPRRWRPGHARAA